jgi:serine/threonine-protein kinase
LEIHVGFVIFQTGDSYLMNITKQSLRAFLLKRKRLLITLGAIIFAFFLLNNVLLPWYVNQGSRLTVPKVTGLPLETAKQTLEAASLQPIESDVRPDPVQPAGTVVNQNPPPSAIVKEGRRVYLTISGGEVQVTVPLLRGKSLRDARFALERYGLKLGSVSYATSESFPENTIIDQSVAADTKLSRGSSVNISVSRGRVSQETTVPELVGKTVAEAEKILAGVGLKVGNISYQYSFELIPNTVVDQYPRTGEPARQGQTVDLFVIRVGKPLEEIQVPPGKK